MKQFIASLILCIGLGISANAQIKALSYNATNGNVIGTGLTNPLTFSNSLAFSTSALAAQTRTNLGLGADWLTNTDANLFRESLNLGTNNAYFERITMFTANRGIISLPPVPFDEPQQVVFYARGEGNGIVLNAAASGANTYTLAFEERLGSWAKTTNSSTARANLGALATNGSAAGLTNFPTLNQNTTGTASNVTGVVAIANGGSGASDAGAARTNFGLGSTWLTNTDVTNFRSGIELGVSDNPVFASVNAGSLGTGIRQSGLDGVLRFDAGTLERARLTPQYQFVLLGSSGNLAFGPDNTNGAGITRTNLGITQDIMSLWAAKDSVNAYVVSSFTGTANVTGSYGESNIAVTNPIGRGLPFYRLNVPNVSPRTNSDLVAIRSSFGSQPYFTGSVRTKIDWSENKYVFLRLASPTVGGGTFQFTLGETATPTFTTNVNSVLPIPSETFIGFSLTRTGTPAQWTPRIISRLSSSASILTNTGSNTSTNDLLGVSRLLLEYRAGSNPIINLYSLNTSGSRTLWVSQTNSAAFTNSTNAHQVNWLMGISPTPPTGTNTVGQMQYDVEPPIIIQ